MHLNHINTLRDARLAIQQRDARVALVFQDIREICRSYRIDKGINQTRLGYLLGCSQQLVTFIERGVREPSDEFIIRLAELVEKGCNDKQEYN